MFVELLFGLGSEVVALASEHRILLVAALPIVAAYVVVPGATPWTRARA